MTETSGKSLRAWWASPPRPGAQRFLSPWEFRHLRGFATARLAGAAALAGLGVVTATFGGNDAATFGWTLGFLVAAAAQVAFASWEISIARSAT
jgi:sugar phosphate permease